MNCKPGDIALVIHALVPENIGKLCTVIAPTAPLQGQPVWLVEMLRPAPIANPYTGKRFAPALTGECFDAWLRPIRGDGVTNEEVRSLYEPSILALPVLDMGDLARRARV